MSVHYFCEVSLEWLQLVKKDLSPGTWNGHKDKVDFFNKLFGHLPVDEITPKMIQNILDDLFQQNKAKATIQKYRTVIKQILNYACREGYLPTNPCVYTQVNRNASQKQRDAISKRDLQIIIDKALEMNFDDLPKNLLLMHYLEILMLFTGVRRSEALAVKINSDFDFKRREIRFHSRCLHDRNDPYIAEGLKNGDHQKIVPMLDQVYDLFYPVRNEGLFFYNRINGKLFTKSGIVYWWRKYQSLYGLNFSGHQLRHTFATICYAAGVDLKYAQAYLGHRSAKVTLDIYTHVSLNWENNEANKLQGFINENIVKKGMG